jgi:AraC-like DNA-binding protein
MARCERGYNSAEIHKFQTGKSMAVDASPLLERRQIFHSREPEQAREFLHAKQFGLEVAHRMAGQLDVRINGVYLPGMYIGYIEYGAPVTVQANPGRDDYWIQLPVRGHLEATIGREVVVCDRGHASISSPNRESRVRSDTGSARINVSLTNAAVTRQLAGLLGEPPDAPLVFEAAMRMTAGYGQSFARYIGLAVAEFENAGSMLSSAIAMSHFEQLIMTGLLLSHPHSYADALRRLDRPLKLCDVRRAIDFMRANLDQPITLADIAVASRVPGRTLFKHFREEEGSSPMRYLRNARFSRVREALRQAGPEQSVTDIAIRWGFTHMGRFSAEYRRRFGETPSATLKRRRLM